ncbi:MAG: SIMPL domain-containing protein, partial [Actinomycetota bacterium]
MRKKITIIFLLVSLVMLAATGCFTARRDIPYSESSELKPQNTIAVAGNGTVEVTPDTVSVTITVLTEETTSEEAVNKNSEISEQVISTVQE